NRDAERALQSAFCIAEPTRVGRDVETAPTGCHTVRMTPDPSSPQRPVTVVEVSPRDGVQADPADLTTDQKVELILRAVRAGIRRIETVSFVNPDRVPKMADADAVMATLHSD